VSDYNKLQLFILIQINGVCDYDLIPGNRTLRLHENSSFMLD
jgi:hypothetical protein